MTIKSVNSEKIPKVKENGWKASKIVGNLGPLSHKDLRYVLRVYKRLEWDFFSDLRKVVLDSRQGKGLKWRGSHSLGTLIEWKHQPHINPFSNGQIVIHVPTRWGH